MLGQLDVLARADAPLVDGLPVRRHLHETDALRPPFHDRSPKSQVGGSGGQYTRTLTDVTIRGPRTNRPQVSASVTAGIIEAGM